MSVVKVGAPVGDLRVAESGAILWLELNRPARHNALNGAVFDALLGALEHTRRSPGLRVVVITAAGSGAFCAGADLDELAGRDTQDAHRLISRGQAVFQALAELSIPSIAAVNGAALGGGFELALSCTLAVASHKATFGLPESGLGLIPGYGGTQRLPLAIGTSTALRLMLTGERLKAVEAYQRGFLVSPPAEPEHLITEAKTLAELIASRGPTATARVLEAVRFANGPSTGGLRHEALLAAMCVASSEAAEGINAFKERRSAVFSNRPG